MILFYLLLFVVGINADAACLRNLGPLNLKACWMLHKQKHGSGAMPPPICRNYSSFTCKTVTVIRNTTMRCPTCFPPEFLRSFCRSEIPICAGMTKPMAKISTDAQGEFQLCPSCRRLDGAGSGCTPEQIKTCYTTLSGAGGSKPAVCAKDERPIKTGGCCVSCVPPTIGCNFDPRSTKIDVKATACEAKLNGMFPRCTNNSKASFKDCCRSCRPMGGADRPVVNNMKAKCSRANFQKALLNAPLCDMGEKGLLNKLQASCAPTCRRATSSYKLVEVVQCLKGLPECNVALGEKPESFPGDRCPTCKPPKPTCTPTCGSNQVCVKYPKTKTNTSRVFATKCVGKGFVKLRLKLVGADFRTKVKAMTAKEFGNVAREMVERYCERPSAVDNCKMFKEKILDSLSIKSKKDVGTDEVDIEIEHSYEKGGSMDHAGHKHGKRRLLQNADPTVLTLNAAQDGDPTEYTVTSSSTGALDTPTSATTKLVSGLTAVLSVMMGLFVM